MKKLIIILVLSTTQAYIFPSYQTMQQFRLKKISEFQSLIDDNNIEKLQQILDTDFIGNDTKECGSLEGKFPLSYAVEKNKPEVVQLLLKYPINDEYILPKALVAAMDTRQDLTIFELLLRHEQTIPNNIFTELIDYVIVENKVKKIETEEFTVYTDSHFKIVKSLLKSSRLKSDPSKQAALLQHSAKYKSSQIFNLILDHMMQNINLDTCLLNNALINACSRQQYKKVERLLECKANPNAITILYKGGYTRPLSNAVATSQHRIVEILLKHNANPNGASHDLEMTPIHYAKKIKIAKLLLQYGAFINKEHIKHSDCKDFLNLYKILHEKKFSSKQKEEFENNPTPKLADHIPTFDQIAFTQVTAPVNAGDIARTELQKHQQDLRISEVTAYLALLEQRKNYFYDYWRYRTQKAFDACPVDEYNEARIDTQSLLNFMYDQKQHNPEALPAIAESFEIDNFISFLKNSRSNWSSMIHNNQILSHFEQSSHADEDTLQYKVEEAYKRHLQGDSYSLQRLLFIQNENRDAVCQCLKKIPEFKKKKYTSAMAFIKEQKRARLPEIRYEQE